MQYTQHGFERSTERTSLPPAHLQMLVQRRSVVPLGSDKGMEFLLFYSCPDRTTKIALVEKGPQKLVSVWNNDFSLPRGVRTPTAADSEEAIRLYFKCAPYLPMASVARIYIYFGNVKLYSHELGEFQIGYGTPMRQLATYFRDELDRIVDIVQLVEAETSEIRYVIEVLSYIPHQARYRQSARVSISHRELSRAVSAVG